MARAPETDRQHDPHAHAEAERTRVGHILRSARLSRDEDLKDVAAKLRIRHPYLEAIEEGRLGDLPGPTYAVGFVRAYADYLGLETEDVVARFKADSRALAAKAELVFPEPLPGGRVPGFALLLVALVLGGLVYGGWLYISGQDRPVAEIIPAVPDELVELIDGARTPDNPPSTDGRSASQGEPPQADAPAAAPETESGSTSGRDEPLASDPTAQAALEVETPQTETPETQGPDPTAPGSAASSPAETDQTSRQQTASEETAGEETAGDQAATTPQPPIRTEEEIAAEAERAARQAADEAAAEAERLAQQQAAEMQARAEAEADAGAQALAERPAEEAGPTPEAPMEAPDETPAAGPSAEGVQTEEPTGVSAQTGAEAETDAPQAPSPPPPSAPQPTAQPAAGDAGSVFGAPPTQSRVSITARVASWIEVTGPDGETLLARLLRAGETYRAPDRAGVTLVTGNAGGLEIVVDGERAPDIGPLGAVRRNVALDPDKLKAGVAAGG
ncbi:MAG: DUF4115 domain-containing protein [Marivibrio sp.]|uniref:helix-turn-helix domain-containing protein n=1 Tax=Marivibrio sp. TaxID=2039719 RepID=UPI0032EF3E7E